MKRDFTQKNYEYFLSLLQQISDEQWCGISDWFGDGYLYVKHFLGDLGLYDKTSNMEKYHKELLDKKNTSAAIIRDIFEKVSDTDSKYAGNGAARYGECLEMLQNHHEYIQALTKIADGGYQVVANGGSFRSYIFSANVKNMMRSVSDRMETIMLPLLFTADTFAELSGRYKSAYITSYENGHPEIKEKLDRVFSDPDFTASEIRDIKFLIYNAPEPYRSIYIEHIEEFQVIVYNVDEPDGDGYEGSLYSSSSRKIYLIDSDNTFFDNERGPYNTFFHESGHAIDDYEKMIGMKSREYVYEGKSLNDWIADDVEKYMSEYIGDTYPNLTDSQKQALMRSLNLTDDATYAYGGDDDLNKVLKQYRKEIVSHMRKELAGEENEAASDVYGGITNNAIIGDYGHRKELNENGSDYNYWYSGGKPTNKQTSELWAEFFAAKMTHDVDALVSIKEHFPNAYDAMEKMAQEMAAN